MVTHLKKLLAGALLAALVCGQYLIAARETSSILNINDNSNAMVIDLTIDQDQENNTGQARQVATMFNKALINVDIHSLLNQYNNINVAFSPININEAPIKQTPAQWIEWVTQMIATGVGSVVILDQVLMDCQYMTNPADALADIVNHYFQGPCNERFWSSNDDENNGLVVNQDLESLRNELTSTLALKIKLKQEMAGSSFLNPTGLGVDDFKSLDDKRAQLLKKLLPSVRAWRPYAIANFIAISLTGQKPGPLDVPPTPEIAEQWLSKITIAPEITKEYSYYVDAIDLLKQKIASSQQMNALKAQNLPSLNQTEQ